jgi:hypothetical protein
MESRSLSIYPERAKDPLSNGGYVYAINGVKPGHGSHRRLTYQNQLLV